MGGKIMLTSLIVALVIGAIAGWLSTRCANRCMISKTLAT